jgi:RNA polymerase sigma factor (sigma-70 family)
MLADRALFPLQGLFGQAHLLAGRAADVRSARLVGLLRDVGLDRDDLRQEVLIAVWLALPRFDPARAGLTTFAEMVTATTIGSLCRRTHAAKRVKPADYQPADALNLSLRVELAIDLRRMLRNLGQRDRRVAQLLVDNGPAQIARQLKISRAAVYRSLGRIRAVLREAGIGR